jgi:ABC-2 type transport system permease protein
MAVFRAGFLEALEYRTDFAISVFSWGIRIFIALFLWAAVAKAQGGAIGGYTFDDILIYFFITQIISSLIFSRVIFLINQDILMGDFSNYMVRPISYIPFRMIFEITSNMMRMGLGIILFGVVLAFMQPNFFIEVFARPELIGLFIIAVFLAYYVNFCMIAMIGFLAFWITNANRLAFIFFGIITIMSGLLFPLDLFPEAIFNTLRWLPLPYIFYYPAKIMQALPESYWVIWTVIVPQLLYASGLTAVMLFVYSKGVRKFEAVGR